MRFIGLDIHRDFCEVAAVDGGGLHSLGRVATTPAELTRFGEGLSVEDEVVVDERRGDVVGVDLVARQKEHVRTPGDRPVKVVDVTVQPLQRGMPVSVGLAAGRVREHELVERRRARHE